MNLFPDCVKLIGYFASAVNVVSCNPCVGPSHSLLSTDVHTDELISAPKIMTFFPHSFHLCRSHYTWISIQISKLPNVKSVFKFLNCGPSV